MSKRILNSVGPLEVSTEARWRYDALIAAVGYEKRARFIANRLRGRYDKGYANCFTDRNVLNYEKNYRWFSRAGFSLARTSDAEFYSWCVSTLTKISYDQEHPRVAVDVSSISRLRIAYLFYAVRDIGSPLILD